jgi:hypothetical protein
MIINYILIYSHMSESNRIESNRIESNGIEWNRMM